MNKKEVINRLKLILKSLSEFEKTELEKIASCFASVLVKKGNLLLQEGRVCKEFYCVITGGIRIYFIDKNGHETTRYIMLENHIGTALSSFIAQKPSMEVIEAIDDTELLSISYTDFYRLNREIINWKMFYQRILEMAYTFQNKKIEQLVTLTAKQRYDSVLKENPAFTQRLSNRVLASYLDIREETLSRLKSR